MVRVHDMFGGLTGPAGVAAVLIAIMGTVSAYGTQAVSAVATSESAAANQATARTDAAALLGGVSLPAGATEFPSEPAGDEGLLAHAGAGGPDTPNVVEAHAWWTVPGPRAEAMAYIRDHAPSGSVLISSGSGGSRGSTTFESVTFAWPPVAGVLSMRWLVLTAAQLPHGSTGLRADTQVVWVTPRPASERITAGARRLSVSVTSALKGNLAAQRPFSVVSAQRIEGIVALLNSLPAAQPGTRACPDDPGIRLRLAFYRPDATSPSALAIVDPYGCGGVRLTIGGRLQAPLGSEALPGTSTTRVPSLILRIDRVLGVKLKLNPHPLGAVTSRAQASRLRQLARSTTSFASDGGRYAAWQVTPASPIVVLDTLTGSRQTIPAPAGCELMRDQDEDGEPSATAADGRFLLDCKTPAHVQSQGVLDVPTASSFALPNGAGFALSRPWTALGTRYLEGTAAPEECSHSPGEQEPCIALFELATGAVSYRPPSQVLNLDLSGAPQICPALRPSLRAQLRYGVLPEQLAFRDRVFARPTANRHNIRIERCNGRSILLRGPREPAAEPGGVRPSEPRSFDLGAGLLTWDTAHNAAGAEMNEQSNAQGTLSSYRLSTGRRQTWKLPPLPLAGAPDIDGSGPEVESPGVYGYSAHTANTVFWIATRTVREAGVTSGLIVETSSVYAASVKSVAVLASSAQAASSYKFEDLAITRQVAADGKPTSGFTSYYRLNRALPFAPRGKFEGEEEGGPRLYAAYVSVDGAHEEGASQAIGDVGRHCYAETIEVHEPEHQPRIGEVVNVALVVKGRRLLTARTRVSSRKFGPTIRERDGLLVTWEALPYEKAFGCLKVSSGRR
jgi:hypothetical protein